MAYVAMSHVFSGSMVTPVRSIIAVTGSPQTGSTSLRLLKPSGPGRPTRIMPAGSIRRWSTMQKNMLLAS